MLKRYIQAGILNFLTPQQIANQGSYKGKFLGELTDLVAIVQSYFTLGLITVTGANVSAASTTAKGVVELATTAETSTGTDTTRAVTPASIAKYTQNVAVVDWVNGGTNSTLTITGATHGKGTNPVVTVVKKNGSTYETTLANTYSYNVTTGDVVITILTADAAISRVIIT